MVSQDGSRPRVPLARRLKSSSWKLRLPTLLRSNKPVLPLLDFPNEILLAIAEHLQEIKDLISLLLTNRRLANLLTVLLHKHAVQDRVVTGTSIIYLVPLAKQRAMLGENFSIPALHWAVWRGHKELVKLLLQRKGFDVNLQDPLRPGLTALGWALRYLYSSELEGMVQLLLGMGADVNNPPQDVLHWAVRRGREAVVRMLLEKGVGIDMQDASGWHPLHWAAEISSSGVLELLLEMGADVSARSNSGATALHFAVQKQGMATVILLLEGGAGVNDKDHKGQAPLHCVSYSDSQINKVEILLKNGADVNMQDYNGETALHLASKSVCKDIASLLIEEGADVRIRDVRGLTPVDLLKEKIKTGRPPEPRGRSGGDAHNYDLYILERYLSASSMIKLMESTLCNYM